MGCLLWSWDAYLKNANNKLNCKPIISYSRTNLFKYSFLKRIFGEWHRLPHDIRGETSVADFKSKVSRVLADALLNFCI